MTEQMIRQLITCEVCKEQYQNPVILPCLKLVCSTHVFRDTLACDTNYSCHLCNQNHFISLEDITSTKSFGEKTFNASDSSIKTTNQAENNKNAKHLCNEFERMLNKCEAIIKEPSSFIDNYFSKIRSKLELSKKQDDFKMKNFNYSSMLEHMQQAERECKLNINNIKESRDLLFTYFLSKRRILRIAIGISNKKLLRIRTHWNIFKKSLEKFTSEAKHQLEKFENELLLNKDYLIKCKSIIG